MVKLEVESHTQWYVRAGDYRVVTSIVVERGLRNARKKRSVDLCVDNHSPQPTFVLFVL